MKNIDVIYKFLNHLKAKTKNLRTDGEFLFNYDTPIACWNGSILIIDRTRYSATTTTIQKRLVNTAKEHVITIHYTDQIIL